MYLLLIKAVKCSSDVQRCSEFVAPLVTQYKEHRLEKICRMIQDILEKVIIIENVVADALLQPLNGIQMALKTSHMLCT